MFLSLFVSSFISATLWPLASEAFFVVAFQQNPDALLLLVTVASAGNSVGAMLMYEMGRLSHRWLEGKLAENKQRLLRLERQLQRHGSPLLFFAWLPVIGDLLPIAAGAIGVHRSKAYLWLALGKTARYVLLAVGLNAL